MIISQNFSNFRLENCITYLNHIKKILIITDLGEAMGDGWHGKAGERIIAEVIKKG